MIGKTVNGFTLQRKLGEGGMAEVWYAENEIGKAAAVKILSASLSHNEQIVERFHNEALVMVKLDHPNIRQVYGYGYIDNRHCIVMEYLDGDDLESLLKKGRRFTEEELRKWWNQIISALNYTHSKGVVHRDIKPSNIFLDNWGNVKLLDFGIAKLKESMSMTRTGTMMGTLMYMSPEQVRDTKNIDYRTDVYSLAVTFAQLVSGTAPYDATNSDDYTIRKGIVEMPYDLSAVPSHWQGFLAPYLEKDPEKRPALRPFEVVEPIVSQEPRVEVRETREAKTRVADRLETPQKSKSEGATAEPKQENVATRPKPVEEVKPEKTHNGKQGKGELFWIIGAAILAVSNFFRFLLVAFSEIRWLIYGIVICVSLLALMLIPLLKKRRNPQTKVKLWQLIALGVMVVLVVMFIPFLKSWLDVDYKIGLYGDGFLSFIYSLLVWSIKTSYLILLIPAIIMASRGMNKGRGLVWIGAAVPVIITVFVFFYYHFNNLERYMYLLSESGGDVYGALKMPRIIMELLWGYCFLSYMLLIGTKNENESIVRHRPFAVGMTLSLIVCIVFVFAYLCFGYGLPFFCNRFY